MTFDDRPNPPCPSCGADSLDPDSIEDRADGPDGPTGMALAECRNPRCDAYRERVHVSNGPGSTMSDRLPFPLPAPSRRLSVAQRETNRRGIARARAALGARRG